MPHVKFVMSDKNTKPVSHLYTDKLLVATG